MAIKYTSIDVKSLPRSGGRGKNYVPVSAGTPVETKSFVLGQAAPKDRAIAFPADYCGFNDETKIAIVFEQYNDSQGYRTGVLTFAGSRWVSPAEVRFDFRNNPSGPPSYPPRATVAIAWDRAVDPITYRTAANNTLMPWAIARGFGLLSYIPVDRVAGTGWLPVDTDRFDSISLRAASGQRIEIRSVAVTLNDIEILSVNLQKAVGHSVEVTDEDPLDLTGYIEDYRRSLVGYESLSRSAYLREFPMQLVEQTCNDIGQAWTPGYCPWDWRRNRPGAWCSEYVAWSIFIASGGNVVPIAARPGHADETRLGSQISAANVAQFFKNHSAFISPTNTPYAQLGERLKPGFYAKMISSLADDEDADYSFHSTFFIRWVDRKGNWMDSSGQPIEFDPNRKWNYFLGIGGNQNGGKVSLRTYTVYDQVNGDDGDVFDNEVNDETFKNVMWHPNSVRDGNDCTDGFGDTSFLGTIRREQHRGFGFEDIGRQLVERIRRANDQITHEFSRGPRYVSYK